MRLGVVAPAVVVVLAGVVAATGCGAADEISPNSVADAAQATIDAGGSRIALDMNVSGSGKVVPLAGSGTQDAKGERGQIPSAGRMSISRHPVHEIARIAAGAAERKEMAQI